MADLDTPEARPSGSAGDPPAAPVDPAIAAPDASTGAAAVTVADVEREFTVRAMTQRQLVTRRFLHHRGAIGGLITFGLVVVLAFSSIGALGIPGWWHQSYAASGIVVDGGKMTLDVMPSFIDGDGVQLGDHPFGQDDIGRDYFAATMRGAQISLMIAVSVGIVATILGALIGALAGFFRGWVEGLLMRMTDVFLTLPLLAVAAVVGQMNRGGPVLLALLLGLLVWMSLARLVRGEFLSLREKEFVEAARALGASSWRIIFKHILPNALGTIIVNATLTIASAILLETALSYLGFGVRNPDTSLGKLISDYENAFLVRPWLFWWPGLFIVAIALSVNFIGDGLRDAFDPKQTRVRA